MSEKKDPSIIKSPGHTFRYRFDNIMSRGTLSLIGFLAVITAIFIIIFTLVLWLTKLFPDMNFLELFWMSLFRTLNTGMMGDGRIGLLYFILALISALVSILITSILIGILTSGIDQRIRNLQKGRSKVIEKSHTIVLGYSEMIFAIISSLVEAGLDKKRNTIVIMGNREKVKMEDEIRERVNLPGNVRLVCRQGDPVSVNDLKIVNLIDSKSIIILEDSDYRVVKILLAINNTLKDIQTVRFNIIATIKKFRNLDTAKIAGQGRAKFILNKKFIAELIAHTCHQPGLSIVYNDLLSFEGDEIYMKYFDELSGRTFRDAIFMFEKCSVIGIESGDNVKLNPPMDTLIAKNDRIVLISADDSAISISSDYKKIFDESSIVHQYSHGLEKENILILGWNDSAKIIIKELDNYISEGTKITIVAQHEFIERITNSGKDCPGSTGFGNDVKNANLYFIKGDITDYDMLENMVLSGSFNHILVLSYSNLDMQEADSITLMVLVHLRDIAERNNFKFSITSEILDIANRELAKVAKVNDFIVSERLTSLLMSQLSENEKLAPIFEDLLNDAGSEIYLKKITGYVKTGKPVNFNTLVMSASLKNEIAIGYKIAAEEAAENKNFGIYLNPSKFASIVFSEDDSAIVLSEKII